MSELIPAEDWQVEFWERCARTYWKDPEVHKRGHGTEVECAVIRDIQRNAAQHWLERAAKAIEDISIVANRVTIQEAEFTRGQCVRAVNKLIPKDPAPAGNENNTGERDGPANLPKPQAGSEDKP